MTKVMLITSCLLAAAACSAAELGDKRLYECPQVKQAPVVDGKLGDACWRQAGAAGQFWRLKSVNEIQPTFFQACYDTDKLYLAVTCLDKNAKLIKADERNEDSTHVMGDDAVEIFIRPDLSAPEYFQFAANALGTRYDGKAFDWTWNGQWQAAANIGTEGWTLECAFSFRSFGRPGVPGLTWGLQVCRDREAGEETEWSAWSPSPGGFHQPDKFGQLIFGGAPGRSDRAVLIECARQAQASLGLEERLGRALDTVKGADAQSLPAVTREQLKTQIAAGEKALQALRDLLAGPDVLDSRAWFRVNAGLRAATENLDEAAWAVRFEKLLAD